jgi:hypothetical protein
MMPEAAVALATFVIVLLVLNRWTRADTKVALHDDEDAAAARRFIATKIDEHVAALAGCYLEAGGPTAASDGSEADAVPGRFAQDIEGFLATVITRDSADVVGLGAAVRRVLTLEREQVYALVVARVQAHLIDHHAA